MASGKKAVNFVLTFDNLFLKKLDLRSAKTERYSARSFLNRLKMAHDNILFIKKRPITHRKRAKGINTYQHQNKPHLAPRIAVNRIISPLISA